MHGQSGALDAGGEQRQEGPRHPHEPRAAARTAPPTAPAAATPTTEVSSLK